MATDALILLTPDGTVVGVEGGLPAEWVGERLEDCADVVEELRRVAAETCQQLCACPDRTSLASRTLVSTSPPTRLVVVRALPIRAGITDLRTLLESTVGVMAVQAGALDITLALDISPELPRTTALDGEKIAWAITALVGNALRFVRRGTRLRPGGEIRVSARYEPAPSRMILEVRDDGSGMPESMVAQVLRPRPGQAAGFALSLIQDVIRAHGGTMQLESSTEPDGSGTTVRLTLPCR